jgi:hypothetical protein
MLIFLFAIISLSTAMIEAMDTQQPYLHMSNESTWPINVTVIYHARQQTVVPLRVGELAKKIAPITMIESLYIETRGKWGYLSQGRRSLDNELFMIQNSFESIQQNQEHSLVSIKVELLQWKIALTWIDAHNLYRPIN